MSKFYWIASLTTALVLAGCGGSGGPSSPSPYAGNYNGSFAGIDNSDSGTVAATIRNSGSMVFNVADASADLAFNGSINNSGSFTGRTNLNGFTITCSGSWQSQTFSLTSTNGVSHDYSFQVESSGVHSRETKPIGAGLSGLGEKR